MSWTWEVFNDVSKGYYHDISNDDFRVSLYRPFTKQHMYFNRHFNNCVYQMPQIFPSNESDNVIICITGLGGKKGFSAIISNCIFDLNSMDAGAQCFPLYLYSKKQLSDDVERFDAITDDCLKLFNDFYSGANIIKKEDIFYYIYGLLHSEEYRFRYADNLTKELPRIPCVKNLMTF